MWNSIGNYHCRYQTKYSPSLSKLSGAYFFLSPKYPQQSHSTLHPKVNSTMIWWKVMPTSSGGKCKNRVIMLTIFTIKSHALVSRPSQKEQPRRQTHTPIHTQIMELNEDKLIMNNTKAVATTSKLWLNRNSYIWFFCHLLAFTQELTCTRSWNRTSKEVEVTIITQGKHSRRKLALKHLSLTLCASHSGCCTTQSRPDSDCQPQAIKTHPRQHYNSSCTTFTTPPVTTFTTPPVTTFTTPPVTTFTLHTHGG